MCLRKRITNTILSVILILGIFPFCLGISITIHGNSESREAVGSTESTLGNLENLNPPERRKRLLPYVNYYTNQNRSSPTSTRQVRYHVYVPKRVPEYSQRFNEYPTEGKRNAFTPFVDGNALPGSFVPITSYSSKNNKPHPNFQKKYVYDVPSDLGNIYDKLRDLKAKQQGGQSVHTNDYEYQIPPELIIRKPQTKNYPVRYNLQSSKTIIQTYSPTNIDVPPNSHNTHYENDNYPFHSSSYRHEPVIVPSSSKSYITKQVINDLLTNTNVQRVKQKKPINRKPIIILQKPPIYYNDGNLLDKALEKPVYLVQKSAQNNKHYPTVIVDENYVAQKYVTIPKYYNRQQEFQGFSNKPPKYEQNYQIQPVTPSPIQTTEPTYFEHNHLSNEDSLSFLLKKLQDANTLPNTLTVNNIDNSIRTLVQILNNLKKQRKFSKPIVVAEENEEYTSGENTSTDEYTTKETFVTEEPEVQPEVPETVVSTYPEDTQEGGTPGTPGVDYPALSSIPPTSFNCKTQRYKGFFGDPDTNCQVWHYCDLNGGQASFLCPNGTIFSQVALTCDWWYNVKCSSTAQLYVLNERLYKYILPFAPKFPEDYTGPLVDKYLALKFMEMEEKMKKERKGKDKSTDETPTTEDEITEETTEETATKSA